MAPQVAKRTRQGHLQGLRLTLCYNGWLSIAEWRFAASTNTTSNVWDERKASGQGPTRALGKRSLLSAEAHWGFPCKQKSSIIFVSLCLQVGVLTALPPSGNTSVLSGAKDLSLSTVELIAPVSGSRVNEWSSAQLISMKYADIRTAAPVVIPLKNYDM